MSNAESEVPQIQHVLQWGSKRGQKLLCSCESATWHGNRAGSRTSSKLMTRLPQACPCGVGLPGASTSSVPSTLGDSVQGTCKLQDFRPRVCSTIRHVQYSIWYYLVHLHFPLATARFPASFCSYRKELDEWQHCVSFVTK